MLQCSFCNAALRKLQRNFRFRLWHVAGVGFREMGLRLAERARNVRAEGFFLTTLPGWGNRTNCVQASSLDDGRIAHLICRKLTDNSQRLIRKILVSVKFVSAILGAGNGCANFMDAWKNALFLQEKPMSIKFLVLGGGWYFGFWGGGGVPILFLWARGFRRD